MYKTSGYSTKFLCWGMPFPNDLSPMAQQPELTWEQFFDQLDDAGVTRLRFSFSGWNNPLSVSGIQAFEYRAGQYNDWDGRLQTMLDLCRTHGITLQACPFDNSEWIAGWGAHGWNRANGGWLVNATDVFSDEQAIQAGHNRLDAIVAMAGDVISGWELCEEMTWCCTPDFWGLDNVGQMTEPVQIMVDWVEEMGSYIHAIHPAPVGNGHVFGDLSANWAQTRNRIHTTPSCDVAWINWYGADLAPKIRWLRECQAYTDLPCYVEQYAPWALGRTAAYTREPEDLSWSKAHEWAAVCGEYGCVGPIRWPEIRPQGQYNEWWGQAHANMAEIGGVTAQYAAGVDISAWRERGEAWDNRVSSNGLQIVSSWGEGRHVTLFAQWGDSNGRQVQVRGLDEGQYRVSVYNCVSGDRVQTTERDSVGGVLEVYVQPPSRAMAALYIEWIPPTQEENQPPTVDVGPDRECRIDQTLSVSGVVEDDGLPDPPGEISTNWDASGPGNAIFADMSAVQTTVTFDTVGVYKLFLTASDGELQATDSLFVTVEDLPPQEFALIIDDPMEPTNSASIIVQEGREYRLRIES